MNKRYRTWIYLAAVVFICAISISAQWNKPYREMSEKEARKLLNDSPWGKTRVVSYTSNSYSPGQYRTGQRNGVENIGITQYLNIRIRFLSARPIRQAFSRIILLEHKDQASDLLTRQLNSFTDQYFGNDIVVSVDCDATESKNELLELRILLDTGSIVDLKPNTYLSANGQRTYLESFHPPTKDGLGAKFIFPRTVNGKPTIDADSDAIEFNAELSLRHKLNMRFKTKDMMINGKLEY